MKCTQIKSVEVEGLDKLAVEVLDNYHKWLVSQGWTGPSFEMIQENAQ